MFSDPPLTKRQLGWLCVAVGALIVVASLAADVVGAGEFNGLGPLQQKLMGGGVALCVFGFTLMPLGERPL